MDKKDIYEHLAKIYLDASSKRKKKEKVSPRFLNNLYFISVVFIVILSIVLPPLFKKSKIFNTEIALVLVADAAKINFNFNPAKKETYSLNLNKLNLKRFKALGFAVKKANYNDIISLRVEFVNAFKEKSEAYFKNIPSKWQDYKIDLADFKTINDWSQIVNLSFIVEEWNTREKAGVVYLDNVRFLR
jgi:hypothetical protein